MADYRLLVPTIFKWEGGYANDPNDTGGPTMKGVTLKTFRLYYGQDRTIEDLKNITMEQWGYIYKKGFWDKCYGDQITSQPVAEMLIDWCWTSGTTTPVKTIQKIVGVREDGKMGPVTVKAINAFPQRLLWQTLRSARMNFYCMLGVRDVKKRKFVTGWLNRVEYFKYD